ncbi:hypothetical protein [Arthrobacter sp. 9AX]|uniref:hypothetical protein n=1 Tax=Arthrobacter sp. 9AX TaxID=2653131 RepID=UPI001F3C3564|nr:hypothetical protein [Arthrobacter sp. 9AX]
MRGQVEEGNAVTDRSAFLGRWVRWVGLGESLGFLAPALAQLVAAAVWPTGTFPLLVVAGFVEGAVLGWFQGCVLHHRLPAVSTPRWILLTGGAAAAAWTLGLLPSANNSWRDWPVAAQIVVGTLGGAGLLGSIGFAQWMELRAHVPRAWRWIAGSAAAWAAGLGVFMAVATPLWQPGQAVLLSAVIGIGAAVLMAVTMAVITGLVMVRLLPKT